MASRAHARLAIIILLLVLQTTIVILELLVFKLSVSVKSWYTLLRQWLGPIGITLLGIILVPVTFAYLDSDTNQTGQQCSLTVDADIAGPGVRIAAFVQVCVLVIVSLLGSFHSKATGAKEVGGGLILTSASLAIALIVRMARSTLTPVDAAIGAMILDGQNMALAIQLTAKETLTSRWQVGLAVLTQFVGLGTISAIVAGFNTRSYASESCSCLLVFWWGWLGNCSPSIPLSEPTVFWTYLACRFISNFQASFHALYNTTSFDRAEKDTRDTADKLRKLGGPLFGITYPHFSERGTARYGEYPATVSFMYGLYGLFALTSLVNAETTLRDLDIEPSSAIDSTGQVIALVIALATFLRVSWLFFFLFRHEDAKQRGFYWPFKLRLSRLSDDPTSTNTPAADRPLSNSLPLGTMLRDPSDLSSKYNSHVPVPEKDVKRPKPTQYSQEKIKVTTEQISSIGQNWFSRRSEGFYAKSLEDISFTPSQDYLNQCAAKPEIQHDFGPGTQSITIYLIVDLRIVAGLRAYEKHEESWEVPHLASMGFSNTKEEDVPAHDAKVVFSYSVREYILTSDGPTRYSVRVNGG
jgi:hypothetical protein